MKPIGVIGGSGMYEMLEHAKMFIHDNRYGRSTEIFEGKVEGYPVYFLPRHGPNHHVIVPRIPYRANVWALKELGAERIIATNSVGSINPAIEVGDMVIPHDYINFTSRTPRSFYDDGVVAYHVDMSPAYCPDIRRALIDAARTVHDGRTYDHAVIIVTEGLSFNTPAEQRLFRQWGADLVGMTTMPEAILAREAALCYAHICMPTDCIGKPIQSDTFQACLKKGMQDFIGIITLAVKRLAEERDCPCSHALDHAILAKQ
jgi:5'-methylthioadenosine phosphorylase